MTEALLHTLLRHAALFSAAVLLVAALRPLSRRAGAGTLYAAWGLVPAVLATAALPRPATEPLQLALALAAAPGAAAVAPALPSPPSGTAGAWLALWGAGTGLALALQAHRQLRLARLGTRLPAGSSPALVGLLRPRIVLPADFEQRFAPAQRALILAHEQVHRSRQDNLWNLLACLLTALHWWNPLAGWAARRFRADQELACDAAVLAAHPGATADYAQALLAAHDLPHLDAPLASRWRTTHPLVERIAMLNHPRPLSARRAALLALAGLGLAGLAYAAQSPAPFSGDAASTARVDIRLTLTVDGRTSQPRLITALGQKARIEWGASPDTVWRLDFTVTRTAEGQLQVLTQPSYAGRPLGEHTAVLASGETIGHRLGGSEGVPLLVMSRVVSLLPAGTPLPAAAAS